MLKPYYFISSSSSLLSLYFGTQLLENLLRVNILPNLNILRWLYCKKTSCKDLQDNQIQSRIAGARKNQFRYWSLFNRDFQRVKNRNRHLLSKWDTWASIRLARSLKACSIKPTEYSTTPATRTLKGNEKQFESGSIAKFNLPYWKLILSVFFSTSVYSAVQI